MRVISGVVAAFVLCLSGSALAQEWSEFISRDDGFRINFPGAPKVTGTAYKSEYGADLPARVYTAERGRERYSMTGVDYTHVSIYMHQNRLYIMEGTVPDGYPEPGLYQQPLGFVDKDGNGIRYQGYYDNDYPPPPGTGGAAITGSGPDPNFTPPRR